jgi:hypothetical protein
MAGVPGHPKISIMCLRAWVKHGTGATIRAYVRPGK